jgi:hypothetical protein
MYKQTGASSILPQKTPDKVSITVGKVEYDVEMDDAQKQEYASAYIKAYRTQVETIKDRTEAGYKKAASRAREIASRYIIKKYHKNGGDLK